MKKLRQILLLWPGVWGLPLAFVLWVVSPGLLRMYDPTAATFDIGIFQSILFAVIAILVFNDVVFMGIKFNFPEVFNYYINEFSTEFKTLDKWQKVKILCCLYLGLLLALVVLLVAVIT